ncbi:MAG: immunoglobulin domain-containing protein, partial [Verrucomicrobiota bacterium]
MHAPIAFPTRAALGVPTALRLVVGLGVLVGAGGLARALEILRPPAAQTIFIGDPVSFRVEAKGETALQYRWQRNGKPVDGASGPEWTFLTTATDHDTTIAVEVIDGASRITSPPARLTIDPGVAGPYRTNRLVEVLHPWRYRVDDILPQPQWPGVVDERTGWAGGGGVLYVEESELP